MRAPSAMRDLHPCPPCGRQGRPGQGFLAGFIERPRGSAPRERDHRGGDHPVPSRTRQLSPPSPRVLQRQAAGGQGVALAEGAFFLRRLDAGPRRAGVRRFRGVRADARRRRRASRAARAGRGPQGGSPPAGLFCVRMPQDAAISLYALREIVVGLTGANLEFGTMKSLNSVTLTQRGNA